MRFALLTDVHANEPALRAALADIASQGCDRIYHTGDLIAIGPYPAEAVDLARKHGIVCIQGNHEYWIEVGLPADPVGSTGDGELMHQHWTHSRLDKPRRDFVRTFPRSLREDIDGVRVLFVHFALRDDRHYVDINPRTASDDDIIGTFGTPDADLVCFGHLHEQRINASRGGTHYLNPGSLGCSHDGSAAYAVVDANHGVFSVDHRIVHYDRADLLARYDRLEIPERDFIRRAFFGADPS